MDSTRHDSAESSVHLEAWPKLPFKLFSFGKSKIIEEMEIVRKIVSLGLEARQLAKIQVRQPLAKIEVKGYEFGDKYIELIKDELNVKEVIYNMSISGEVALDTKITSKLKAEGEYRDFMRELQDTRKRLGLAPGDKMAMSIETIYKKYKIIPSLQEHMLRVAAVASLICDNFSKHLSKEDIITACLLHDMGNIIKFKLDTFPDFLGPEGLEYWENTQVEFKEKYGDNEYLASLKIAQELQISDRILELIQSISFLDAPDNALGEDFAKKIPEYCDDRVSPFGVVSLEQRFMDLRKRYAHRGRSMSELETFENAVRQMEKQIFSKCRIKPEDINDETVAPVISELKNFMIK